MMDSWTMEEGNMLTCSFASFIHLFTPSVAFVRFRSLHSNSFTRLLFLSILASALPHPWNQS